MPVVLPALPAVMAGFFGIILLFGVLLLVDVFLRAIDLSKLPGVIADGLRVVTVLIVHAVEAINSLLAALSRSALGIFSVPAMGFVNLANAIAFSFARLGSWTRWLVRTEIPALWTGIVGTVAVAVNQLTGLATRLFSQAIAYTQDIGNLLSRVISNGLAVANAYTLSLYHAAMGALATGLANVSAYALGLTNALGAILGLRINSVIDYVIRTAASLSTYANLLSQWAVMTAVGAANEWAKRYSDQLVRLYDAAIAGAGAVAIAPAWPAILSATDAISLALPDSIAAVLARIGAIPRAIPNTVATEIGAIAGVGAIAIDFVAKCGLDLCRNSKPFGNALAGLEDFALIELLFELIIDGAEDPNGTADTVHNEIAGPLTALGHEFGSLLSI